MILNIAFLRYFILLGRDFFSVFVLILMQVSTINEKTLSFFEQKKQILQGIKHFY